MMRWRRRKHDRVLADLESSAEQRLQTAKYEAGVTAGQASEVAKVTAEAEANLAHNHFIDHIRLTLQPRTGHRA